MENSFLYTPAEALEHFNVSEQTGLTQGAVLESRKKHGPNGKHCFQPL
jgi:Ca2+ transporting ATPase